MRYIKHGGHGVQGSRINLLQSKITGVFLADYRDKRSHKCIRRSLGTTDLTEAKKMIAALSEQRKNNVSTRDSDDREVLYVIQRGDNGPVKVGISRRLKDRIATLQNGNAEKLSLLRTYRMADVEKAIHAELGRESRLSGEWFSADLLARVDSFFGKRKAL